MPLRFRLQVSLRRAGGLPSALSNAQPAAATAVDITTLSSGVSIRFDDATETPAQRAIHQARRAEFAQRLDDVLEGRPPPRPPPPPPPLPPPSPGPPKAKAKRRTKLPTWSPDEL